MATMNAGTLTPRMALANHSSMAAAKETKIISFQNMLASSSVVLRWIIEVRVILL
jgi:hypothetical protein